jgi:hypothetical protein
MEKQSVVWMAPVWVRRKEISKAYSCIRIAISVRGMKMKLTILLITLGDSIKLTAQ